MKREYLLERMPIGSFLNSLKNGVVNPKGNGACEDKKWQISENTYQAEVGQREEHAEYAPEHGAWFLWIAPIN